MEREGALREYWIEEKEDASCVLHWVGDRRYGDAVTRAFTAVAGGGTAQAAE